MLKKGLTMDNDAVTLYVGAEPLVQIRGNATNTPCGNPISAKLRALLAAEYQAFAMYRHAAYRMRGKDRIDYTADLFVHAGDELGHADQLEKRLMEVGGKTFDGTDDYSKESPAPAVPLRGPSPEELFQIIEQSEADAVRLYREAFAFFAEQGDIVSAKLTREILEKEEEHLADVRIDYQGKDSAV